MTLAVGDKAPSVQFVNAKRESVSLESFRGKKLVVAFIPAAFTGVCEKELCTFRDSISELEKLSANIVAVSVDAPFANAAFAEKNKLSFPVLSDYTRAGVQAFGVAHDDFAGLPGYTAAKRSVFVFDGDGIARYAWVAPNPGVEPNYAEVQQSLAAL